ncbi:NeuD/PglB/VioB family sugar acetyltransferase [Chitinilyticum piscinae]|uniref:NeuD/PglB/VioB family sugar acetyltransferase n=1 Tax=Chitinilyticum piscinae TaxID=2866724 RepID=A0A8J7FQW2_9NEIS|nr:NeuD/PglB/VioB family sugar acetyltransferase [Chitinilyticum piscinae]MBE9610649.1 NeuD/PglB/VioB family sugar acetyltransferase [Chitinilyticum piscinae]
MSALVLVGGGGHGRSCLDVARSAGIEVAGFVDRDPSVSMAGVPWLGGDDWLATRPAGYTFLVTVGQVASAVVRVRLFNTLQSHGLPLASLQAPTAMVSPSALLGAGCAVLHRALVHCHAQIGDNVIVNSGSIIEHDARVGAHCHVSTGAIVNGCAVIGQRCMIGSGAVVLQGVSIADDVVVGAGAVVTCDITEAGTWVGVPARKVK